MITTDPRCSKRYRANDTDGHCTNCHRTFAGETAFTKHQRLVDGELVCEDPENTVWSRSGELKFGRRDRPGTSDGVAWGIGSNPSPWARS